MTIEVCIEEKNITQVYLLKNFLFPYTSKNNCFTKVLEVIKLFLKNFWRRIYQRRDTFGGYIAQNLNF